MGPLVYRKKEGQLDKSGGSQNGKLGVKMHSYDSEGKPDSQSSPLAFESAEKFLKHCAQT